MFCKRVGSCITLFLLCIGVTAHGQTKPPEWAVSERLIAPIDLASSSKEFFKASPDGRRVVYTTRVGNKQCVTLDAKAGKLYDGIEGTGPVFSPDSKRVAYMARLGNRILLVVDGKEGKEYDGILVPGPVFSPDSSPWLMGLKWATDASWW